MKRSFMTYWLCLLIFPALLLAATTGSLRGKVSNAASGEPIAGVNVVLEETPLGSASDINGVFQINNIPAGTYTLRVTSVGYKTAAVENLKIHADLQAAMDVNLEETAIAGEVVTIFAERPLIEIDKTSSVQITESADLQNLPVRGYSDIIKIQSGVQSYSYNTSNAGRYYNENTNGPKISVRGSRDDEVMFNVDGVSLNDPYSGFVTFRVPDLAWNELSFLKGNFSAEYGRFMSGVVNWTTKSGGEDYHAEAEMSTDRVINDEDHSFEQDKYGFAVSGPIIPGNNRYRIFAAYERGDHGDRSPSWVDRGVKSKNSTVWDALAAKITTNPTDNMRLDVGLLYSDEVWNEYRHSYYFNLEHMPWYHDENLAAYVRYNHAVAADLNYTLTANYTAIERFRGDNSFRDDIWAYGTVQMPNYDATALFWQEGRMYRNFMKRKTEYYSFRGDLQKLWGEHDFQTGLEMQTYTLRFYEHGFPNAVRPDNAAAFIDLNNFGYTENGVETDAGGDVTGPHKPVVMGFYAQDKIRLEYGIRVNVGLRWDYLDPDARQIKDPHTPFGADGSWDINDDTEATSAFSIWSPRLGVSFPVSDVTTFHFNYGRYTQFPAFYSYYVDYDYFEHIVADSPYHTVIGNPNLEPTKTTSYEFGIDHALGEYSVFAFTAYYKSIEDYVNAQNISAEPSSYSTYFNMDRAVSKGLEFEFRLKPYKRFAAAVNYTLSWANGTGSSNNGNDRVAWTGSDPPKFSNPLVFDRRHHVSGVVTYTFDKNDGPRIGGYPFLENTTFGFNLDAASGRPYTKKVVYNEVSLGATFPENERSINSVYIDWTYQLDFRLTRTIPLYRSELDLFCNVINVLDAENFVSVWESSGVAGTTYWLETPEGQNWVADQGEEGEARYRLRETDPNNWNVPRMVQVGLAVRY